MSEVGDSISAKNANWSFDGDIVEKFESHINKSAQLYELIIECADIFLKKYSICYELGCSSGSLLHKLSERFKGINSQFICLDEVEKMIKFANKKYKNNNLKFNIANVLYYEYQNADMIINYYLLQFTRPSFIQNLIDQIYSNLNWGGAFLCFEKVRSPDARFQDITTSLYCEYKLKYGYVNDEILDKSRSLKGILELFSTQGNLDIFKRARFKDITSIFKSICFEGFLCIK